jgi:TDG/mug DNA glycosylase family protein
MDDVLPDLTGPRMRVVFSGTAAGPSSAVRGVYYAGRGNRFWTILAEIGLTPRRLAPEEFRALAELGIGLTDVAKKASGTDAHIAARDFDVQRFVARLRDIDPQVVAFNGKKAAAVVLGEGTRDMTYGLHKQRIGRSRVFVLPSTSGNASAYWSPTPWFELARSIDL